MYPSSNKKWKLYAPNLTVQLLRYWDKFYFASAGRARARAKYSSIFIAQPSSPHAYAAFVDLQGRRRVDRQASTSLRLTIASRDRSPSTPCAFDARACLLCRRACRCRSLIGLGVCTPRFVVLVYAAAVSYRSIENLP